MQEDGAGGCRQRREEDEKQASAEHRHNRRRADGSHPIQQKRMHESRLERHAQGHAVGERRRDRSEDSEVYGEDDVAQPRPEPILTPAIQASVSIASNRQGQDRAKSSGPRARAGRNIIASTWTNSSPHRAMGWRAAEVAGSIEVADRTSESRITMALLHRRDGDGQQWRELVADIAMQPEPAPPPPLRGPLPGNPTALEGNRQRRSLSHRGQLSAEGV